MAVRPVTFNADGSIEAVCDETQHSGTIAVADIKWAADPVSGVESHSYIVLNCPDGCGVSSLWPVSGGAGAAAGQQMFVEKTKRDGCACGACQAGDSSALPESHVRLNVNRQDGAGRWQLG